MRAEAADPSPWQQHALLGRDRREADALRDLMREHVIEHPVDEAELLMIASGSNRRSAFRT